MKKGFTIIELITSFVIISVVSVLLFNIIFSLKELYISGDIKTSLLVKQGILTRKINHDLNTKYLNSVRACGISCINFEYKEEVNGEAVTTNTQLLVDVAANSIKYGNYVMKLNKGTEISYDKKNHMELNYINSVLYLNIPIKSSLLEDENFGIKIVRKIDNLDFDNRIKFADASIVANGIAMPISKINFSDEYVLENTSDEPDYTLTNKYALFAKIFHQSKLTNGSVTSFSNYDEFIRSNTSDKFSSLKSLEKFKSMDKKDALITKLKTESNTEEKLEKEFSNGYYELILDYPGYNSSDVLENYNWWTQTSDFTLEKDIKNVVNFKKSYSSNWNDGLKLLDNNSYFVTGSTDGTYYSLGSTNDTQISGPGSVDSVDLYVRVDEYIKKYSLAILDDTAGELVYTLTFDAGEGTIEQNSMQIRPAEELSLPTPTPPTGYSFIGWYTEENGKGDLINNDTIITSNMTLYAHYIETQRLNKEFLYTGSEQTFTIPVTGKYKLEVWGAQGGSSTSYVGGYGGYSVGVVQLNQNQSLYVNVGGAGTICTKGKKCNGGYNGGGGGSSYNYASSNYSENGSGGGATHIATVSGELKNLETYKGQLSNDEQYYISNEILIVAGGGGGSQNYVVDGAVGNGNGQSGGGFIGTEANNCGTSYGGTQISGGNYNTCYNHSYSTAGSFGLGGMSTASIGSGGGGGFFGGAGSYYNFAPGGSGYIASSNLVSSSGITKHMTCYNCETSDEVNTKTISNTCSNSDPTVDCSKTGHGYAKITYIGE